MARIFVPGCGLHAGMYSRLDAASNGQCIDIAPQGDWNTTLSHLSSQIPPGALGVGYSMGARLLLGAALASPHLLRGLVLISVHTGITDPAEKARRQEEDLLRSEMARNDLAQFWKVLDSNPVFQTSETSISDVRISSPEIVADQVEICGLGSMPSYEERLIELRIPVLYLTGVRDTKYTKLSARYKKLTPFSHHRTVDADHRVVSSAPHVTSHIIEWFTHNVANG